MGKKVAFLIGFLVGCMVGWVWGILSAPASGKETLDTIGEKAIELRDKAEQAADRVKEQVMSPLSSVEDLDADYTRAS